jgi:hypothetical protein
MWRQPDVERVSELMPCREDSFLLCSASAEYGATYLR